jgi:hypothetical protein
MTDIDIDFIDPTAALQGLTNYRLAAQVQANGQRCRHASGVYFQDIPTDPIDGLAAWDYDEAAEHGYFKLDFLPNHLYRGVRDETHLITLMNTEPPWHRLSELNVVSQLAQLANYYSIVQMIEPQCIEDLAVCIALIRPGKKDLISRPRFEIMQKIWIPTPGFYYYRRSHAIAYAVSIVVQFNHLIEQGLCE